MTVHAQLRAAYHASGLSYQDIADKAQKSENTVGRLLCGENVTLDTLVAVAKVLGVSTITIDQTQSIG